MTTSEALFERIGSEIKSTRERIGELSDLDTADQSSIVAAINEIAATGGGGGSGGVSAGYVTAQIAAHVAQSDPHAQYTTAAEAATAAESAVSAHTAATDPHPQYATAAEAASAAPVQSVAGRTGDVTLSKSDVGLSAVDNTSDASKPVSTATAAALAGKADISHTHAYSGLTGLPTLGTAAALNVPASGNAGAGEVVKGSDTRLSDARTPTAHTHAIADVTGLQTALDGKQPALVSGTNIKTINGSSLLGSGDLIVSGGGGGGDTTTQALQAVAPTAPAAGNLTRFARNYSGRGMASAINPDNSEQIAQPMMARKAVALAIPAWGSSALTVQGLGSVTATGTATAAAFASTSAFTAARRVEYLQTTAGTSAIAGFRWGQHQVSRATGFHLVFRFGLATGVSNASHRLFIGLQSSTVAPMDANPSTLTNVIGIGYDAADTQLQAMSNDGSGTAVKAALGASFAKPAADRTSFYEAALYCAPGGSAIGYEVLNLTTGAVVSGTIDATDLPAASTALCPNCYASVGGVSSVVGLALMNFYSEVEQ